MAEWARLRGAFLRACIALAILLQFTWDTHSAHAAPPQAEAAAAKLKAQGDKERDELHYEQAITLYDQSYAIVPNPAVIYNKARVYEFLGEYPKALDLLEEFARKAPAELKAKVNGLDRAIADVALKVTTLKVQCNVASAELRINGRTVATLSNTAESVLRVKSGKSQIEVTVDGYLPFKRELLLLPRTDVPLLVELQSKLTTGTLLVTTLDGASIEIDGETLGKSLVEVQLKAGNHSVRATLEGMSPEVRAVVVAADSKRELKFDKLRGIPLTKRWWFWTAVGAVVVGGTVATIVAYNTERAPTPSMLGTIGTGLRF
jgi:hypothetical protein